MSKYKVTIHNSNGLKEIKYINTKNLQWTLKQLSRNRSVIKIESELIEKKK